MSMQDPAGPGAVREDREEDALKRAIASGSPAGAATTAKSSAACWTFGGWRAAGLATAGSPGLPPGFGLEPILEHQPLRSARKEQDGDSDSRHATPMFIPGIRDHTTAEDATARAKRRLQRPQKF
eukprot:CAMPEP_0168456044 /NCGR_PEP_ID=MMETSP0228-20121227/51079_1 /TAXON_ID=133427 /ORGANISM="Protoceratium reticulatum, Strain CCCM 535 (=CCMP 1889)" /LENGTH=124 /DNA_ID=CAMNT_0008470941 /DNA_START=31 /DNA_END=402 /DNA_ORIENTATION=+